MARYVGIDPGLKGALAVVDHDGAVEIWPMPRTEREIADLFERALIDDPSVFACLERQQAMRKGGRTPGLASTGKFLQHYGFLRGLLCAYAIAFDDPTPQRWQRALGCLSKGDKHVTLAKAQQLFPRIKITLATADAVLLAEYARRFSHR